MADKHLTQRQRRSKFPPHFRSLARGAAIALALATGGAVGQAGAAERPPVQDPILMIEAGMHVGVIRRAGVDEYRSLLVTGSDDKTVRVWSLPGGRLQRVLRVPIGPGEAGEVRAVAISPNGMLVAAAGWDAYYDVGQTNYVYVFNTATGAMVGRLGPLPNVIHELEFSPDGYYLVAGLGNENGIRVWDIASRRETYADKDYGGDVYGIAWASDGRLATTSYDGKVRLYSPELKLIKSAKTKGGVNPSGIAFSPDGNEIAVGFIDTAAVDILSAKDLTRQARPDTKKVTNGNVASVAWSSDGQTLYAGGRWRTNDETPVVAWSKRGRGPMKRIGGTSDTVMDLLGGAGGDLIYGAADPQIGYFEGGTQHIWRDRVTADMHVKLDENFLISSDAQRVRFGLNFGIDEPYLFDIGMLSFNQAPKAPRDMHQPDTTKLKVADWRHNGSPKLSGKPLEIARYEWSRSVAVLPDASGLVLGSDFSVARFDRKANKEWTIPVPGAAWGVNISDDGQLLVVAYGDGTIRWHRTSDGRELLAFFVHRETKEWVAWTPKGYYATSPGGEKLIGWQVNRGWEDAADFFPADRFRDRFYRPDIIQRVLAAGDEEVAITDANREANRKSADDDLKNSLPPVIDILAPAEGGTFSTPDLTVRYAVRSPSGQPIVDVEVLIDGRPLDTRGLSRVEPPAGDASEGEIAVTLPSRDVEVALIARTAGATSVPAKVALRWEGGAARDMLKPKLYALLVGVSNYEREDLRLNFANQDAIDLNAALQRQAGGLYREVETKLLTDADATADNIRDALDWLEHEVTSQDVALLFLAGHGVTDEKLRFYYLPVDVDPDRLRSTAIPESGIRDVIGGIAGKVLFMVDACHSAEGLGDRQSRGGAADITSIVNEFAAAENGIVMFASSTGREVSVEDKAWANGAFTEALIEGLEGKADITKDGSLTTAELGFWLSERVKTLTEGRQHPVVRRPDIMPDFPMALVGSK